jgi:hypothetical protein
MSTRTVVILTSDNFKATCVSFEAYREIRLSMSTGDFHTHEYEVVEVPENQEVIEVDDLLLNGELV